MLGTAQTLPVKVGQSASSTDEMYTLNWEAQTFVPRAHSSGETTGYVPVVVEPDVEVVSVSAQGQQSGDSTKGDKFSYARAGISVDSSTDTEESDQQDRPLRSRQAPKSLTYNRMGVPSFLNQ